MFAQDDGAVVIRLEKMNDVMVNSESKVINLFLNFRFPKKCSRNICFHRTDYTEHEGLTNMNAFSQI